MGQSGFHACSHLLGIQCSMVHVAIQVKIDVMVQYLHVEKHHPGVPLLPPLMQGPSPHVQALVDFAVKGVRRLLVPRSRTVFLLMSKICDFMKRCCEMYQMGKGR